MRESRAIPSITRACGIERELGVQFRDHEQAKGSEANYTFVRAFDPQWFPSRSGIAMEPLFKEEPHGGHRKKDREPLKYEFDRILPNGARFYVDSGPHAEISTPLCHGPRMLTVWDSGCRLLIDHIRQLHEAHRGVRYRVYCNNVGWEYKPRDDRFTELRETWGCHENYCVWRRVPEEQLIAGALPWFVMRTPIIGAGKVGSDYQPGLVDFQISQRAEFFTEEVGSDTVKRRPIYNTRDEPLADRRIYRRVHVIPGDHNMLELPTYLKIGITTILFMMIEDKVFDADRFAILDPVATFHRVSWDTGCDGAITFVNRKETRNIVDCLWDYWECFSRYLDDYHPTDATLADVLRWFEKVLKKLAARDWEGLFGWLDWVTKKRCIERKLSRTGKGWNDALAYELDIAYHDDHHQEGLFHKFIKPHSIRISTDEEVAHAVFHPPPTRSRLLVEVLEQHRERVSTTDCWYEIQLEEEGGFFAPRHTLRLDPQLTWNEQLEAVCGKNLPLGTFLKELARHEGVNVRTVLKEDRMRSMADRASKTPKVIKFLWNPDEGEDWEKTI